MERISIFLILLCTLSINTAHAKWEKDLPPLNPGTTESRWVRSIIHIHSVFSHDACDGDAQTDDGQINESCLNDYRQGLCRNHAEVVFLTEHRRHLAHSDFTDALVLDKDNQPIYENGEIIGSRLTCPDGFQISIFPGSENSLMPIGLKRHPELLPDKDLEGTYDSNSKEAIDLFRDAGALVGLPHTEEKEKTVEYIKDRGLDFIEIYNLHANLESLYTTFRPIKLLEQLFNIIGFMANKKVEPDMFFLSFLSHNKRAQKKWAQLAMDQHITGIASSDVHQNAFKFKMHDGERPDGYRRNIRWFSNFINIKGPVDRSQLLEKIKAGKVISVFEIFGTPRNFTFKAISKDGEFGMGETVPHSASPVAFEASFGEPTLAWAAKHPKLRMRLMKATSKGWKKIDRSKTSSFLAIVDEPGAYRMEVLIKPTHLKKELATAINLIHWYPYIYSNPIYIR